MGKIYSQLSLEERCSIAQWCSNGRMRAPSAIASAKNKTALGGLADAVGMRASAGQIAAIHDQILLADWSILKPAFQYFPSSRGVAGLS